MHPHHVLLTTHLAADRYAARRADADTHRLVRPDRSGQPGPATGRRP